MEFLLDRYDRRRAGERKHKREQSSCPVRAPRRLAAFHGLGRSGDLEISIPPGPRRRSYAKARVDVRQHLDGSWSVYYQDRRIAEHEATALSKPQRERVKTRRSRPAKGAAEAVLVYFPVLDAELSSAAAAAI